jgi:ABC-type transport system involved in multi-copper enzyme maturation permease subunit
VSAFAIASGEIRQRLREPGFLLLVVALAAFATYLAPSAGSGYSTISVGRSAVYGGSALAGTSSGMDFVVFSGFLCIFALGTGFARDERTRLSELLRAQPVATAALVLGRVLSSWALGAMLAFGAMLLLGLTLAFREGTSFEPLAFGRNFLVLALPGMAVIASLAALLDVLLGRWRGVLIAAGLIGYVAILGSTVGGTATGHPRPAVLDFSGLASVQTEFNQSHGTTTPLNGGLLIEEHPGKPIFWSGLVPTTRTVVARAIVLGEAACLGALALAFYRRRSTVKRAGAQAVEPQLAGRYVLANVTPPLARARGAIGRIAVEVAFRARKNLWLTGASLALFVAAILASRNAHHWVVAGAILLPLFWIRAFDDAVRPRSLDESLGALTGGLAGDWVAKSAALAVFCAAPLLGLPIGNPGDPMVWAVATVGLLAEILWLTTVNWVFRAELFGLGVVALLWYAIAFNDIPQIDYARLWNASATALAIDAVVAAALAFGAQTLLRRRA